MKKLFLHKFHTEYGANFKSIEDCIVPANYGNVVNELDALYNTLGLLDRSYLGKILVKGTDSLDLLNRISTNDLQYLSIGTVCDTIFITPKGRLIDYCRIINLGKDEYILICSFIKTNHLLEWINRFIILEDVEVSDVSDDYIWITFWGSQSQKFLNKYSNTDFSEADEAIWLEYESVQFPAFKNNNFLVPAYNFCFSKDEAQFIFPEIINSIHEWNGSLIGDDAFQILRVESGMPDWGTEINEDYNPHEARLIKAVSFTKGCYTGQEVIARLDTYDKVQKYIMIIDIFEIIEQDPPLDIYIEDELIGKLTSYVNNPVSGNYLGLGYIKKMFTSENDIYVELQTTSKRVPAKLRKPPTAY
jgi:tRNA-modifying protein YgfZ